MSATVSGRPLTAFTLWLGRVASFAVCVSIAMATRANA